LVKLGKETVTLASKPGSRNAEKIKALDETLTEAAEGGTTETAQAAG